VPHSCAIQVANLLTGHAVIPRERMEPFTVEEINEILTDIRRYLADP
jgi:hypothetical protein